MNSSTVMRVAVITRHKDGGGNSSSYSSSRSKMTNSRIPLAEE